MIQNVCRKCKSTQFTYKEVIKNDKAKYYKTCNSCGKVFRLRPKNNAYHFYLEYCKMEARLKYKDTDPKDYLKNVVKEEKRLQREFLYLKDNFEALFVFIIRNNSEKEKKLKVTLKFLAEILKKYKTPLTENDYMNIINEIATSQVN